MRVVLQDCHHGSWISNAANCGAPERSELEPELVEPPKYAVEASQTNAELINRGQGIAEAACASCHAIGLNDTSQHAEAPAFRTIGQKYSVWTLDEALAEVLWWAIQTCRSGNSFQTT